jgi:hypothetical protein
MLKKDLLEIFQVHPEWLEQDRSAGHAANFAVIAAFWNKPKQPYLSDVECRSILQQVDDADRVHALRTLNDIVTAKGAWAGFGQRFFSRIWPQESRFQTGATSEAMVRIAEENPELFPKVVAVIEEFLRPIDHPDTYIYRQRRETEADERQTLAQRWPREVLTILDRIIAKEPAYAPDQLAALLTDIAEADPATRSFRAWRRLHELVVKI